MPEEIVRTSELFCKLVDAFRLAFVGIVTHECEDLESRVRWKEILYIEGSCICRTDEGLRRHPFTNYKPGSKRLV